MRYFLLFSSIICFILSAACASLNQNPGASELGQAGQTCRACASQSQKPERGYVHR